MLIEDLLERHLAVKLGVQRDEDGAQAAAGVGPQHAKPLAVGGGRADGVAGGTVGVAVLGVPWPEATWPSVASISGSPSLARLSRVDLPAGTAARLFSTSPPCRLMRRAGLDGRAIVAVQIAAGYQMVGQSRGLVAGPSLKGGDEGTLVDQAVLQREQSEEEVAVRGGGHDLAANIVGRAGGGSCLRGRHGRSLTS